MNDGFFMIPNEFIDAGHLAKLSPTALRVALVLARGQGGNNVVWWGPSRIAQVLGLADMAAVKRAMRELRDKGLLTVVEAGGGDCPAKRHITLIPGAKSAPGHNQPQGEISPLPEAESTPAPRAESTPGPGAKSAPLRITVKKNIEKEHEEVHALTLYDAKHSAALSAVKAQRSTDPIWETVATLWYGGTVLEPHRSHVGKLTKAFKDLNATADEIRVRAARYRKQWPNIAFTGDALIKHWSRFGTAKEKIGGPFASLLAEGEIHAQRKATEIADLKAKIRCFPSNPRVMAWKDELSQLEETSMGMG